MKRPPDRRRLAKLVGEQLARRWCQIMAKRRPRQPDVTTPGKRPRSANRHPRE